MPQGAIRAVWLKREVVDSSAIVVLRNTRCNDPHLDAERQSSPAAGRAERPAVR
jgi:hypothetical protein